MRAVSRRISSVLLIKIFLPCDFWRVAETRYRAGVSSQFACPWFFSLAASSPRDESLVRSLLIFGNYTRNLPGSDITRLSRVRSFHTRSSFLLFLNRSCRTWHGCNGAAEQKLSLRWHVVYYKCVCTYKCIDLRREAVRVRGRVCARATRKETRVAGWTEERTL